jgi:hypothetical protein
MVSFDELSDAELLELTGETLCGPRWRAQIADKIGVSRSLVAFAARGERRLSDKHREALASGCSSWLAQLFGKRNQVESLMSEWRSRALRERE